MPLEINPSKDLTKEEQMKVLRGTPEWQAYIKELEYLIQSKQSSLVDCAMDEVARLQGEIKGLRLAKNIITDIK